jgi:hypothetical protein
VRPNKFNPKRRIKGKWNKGKILIQATVMIYIYYMSNQISVKRQDGYSKLQELSSMKKLQPPQPLKTIKKLSKL